MKIPKPCLFLFAGVLALGAINPPHARAQVSVSFFYDNLSPYGEWVQDPDYGYCWHPLNVDDNWEPYTDGYWAYTDGGWTWVSYEDYGGIVYHYGRWAHIPGEGWVWVPGYTWAPAWVSWRSNDSYIGWAPLPPEARWHVGIGFGGWVDARFGMGPGFYSFVNVGDFGAPALGAVILPREQNVTFINKTTNITNITYNNSNVYTGGPSYAKVSAASTRPIPTLKLVRQGGSAAIRGANGKILSRQQGSQLMVIAPKITPPSGGKLPPPPTVAKTLTGVKADHGWDIVKDPQEREALQTKFKTEGGSGETPAKPPRAEDLKIVADKTGGKSPATGGGTKTAKTKPTSLSDLENAPATEEPSPKNTKKAHAFESPGDEGAVGGETPKPRHKSKKAKTPGSDETGGGAVEEPKHDSTTDESEAPKHESTDDSNLHPFLSGGSTDTAKPSEYTEPSGGPQGAATGEEPEKGAKKKKKGKGEATPGG